MTSTLEQQIESRDLPTERDERDVAIELLLNQCHLRFTWECVGFKGQFVGVDMRGRLRVRCRVLNVDFHVPATLCSEEAMVDF